MGEQLLINQVHSTTTHIPGRALNSVGVHHFVIDGSASPKEEITPIDAFLAGISACAVHLLERFAQDAGVALQRADASIEAIRRADDLANFQAINLRLELRGPSQSEAEELAERFAAR